MLLKKLDIEELLVNPKNDRHGELPSEKEAIAWLFHNREQHMKNLALDIAEQGEVYEAPLVAKHNRSKFIVHDGNRRVSCLKLLLDPKKAPTSELKAFFETTSAGAKNGVPTKIECQIEADLEKVDEIVYRRHTGVQDGIGRSAWDDTAKQNFINRTGKQQGINLPEQIEVRLLQDGHLASPGQLPRSNLKRLLSAEEFRNPFGISLRNNKLYFTHDPSIAVNALRHVADDLINQRLVLGDLWNNDQKRRYMDDLLARKILPPETARLATPVPFESQATVRTQKLTRTPTVRPIEAWRDTLIRRDVDYRVNWSAPNARSKDIWIELQSKLFLDRHANAIAVLFRVLLELAVDHYIIQTAFSGSHPNDHLKNKVEKLAADMEARGAIDTKYFSEIRKFANGDSIISANTMNRYVHSTSFTPSPKHLTAIWDVLAPFIVSCLNATKQL